MRDQTEELRNTADASGEGESLMITPEISSAKEESENEAFLKKVQDVHETLQNLKRLVSDLENKQNMVLNVALPEDSMKTELQTLRDEIKLLAGQLCRTLKSIEPKGGRDDGEDIPVNGRMQKTQHAVLSKEILELMDHFDTIQAEYRDRNVERIWQQLKICGTNVTDEELDQMLGSGQSDAFHNILNWVKANRQALDMIEYRHDEILKLECSVKELHKMFQKLDIRVEDQGEQADINENIRTKSYLENVNANLEEAVTYHQTSNKLTTHRRKVWIGICLAILLLIVIVTLLITLA